MRTFADPSFFRLIYSLLGEAHTDLRRTVWSHRGVNWHRQRHSFQSGTVAFTIDYYLLSRPNPNGWSLLVVRETWWDGDDKVIRNTQWSKPLTGSRSKMLEWLRGEERRIAAQPVPKAAE